MDDNNEKIEIERKFLLTEIPKLDYVYNKSIHQFFINQNIRFRREETFFPNKQKNVFCYCCIKEQININNPCINIEKEFAITLDMFDQIFKNGIFKQVRKNRYIYFFKNQKFELDVFDDGLCLCEIELNNSEQKIYFPKEIKDRIIINNS